jgi:4-amino-4-deoxy-L-arabinose transferase-like glycosyltransferase
MSSPLEKFILENRDKFDADSPDTRVWEKISERINPETKNTTPVRNLPFKRWMAAAAAVVLLGLTTVLYFSMHQNKPANIAGDVSGKTAQDINPPKSNPPLDSPATLAKTDPSVVHKSNKDIQPQAVSNNGDNNPSETVDDKAMYYYAKLIELKHEELKTLEKDEPLLYRQFSGDVQKLDSVYHLLKTQLPKNSNREQVIEAMISNLQLQIGLLNKQLDIIKQIKHSKKSAYEKAYKSV